MAANEPGIAPSFGALTSLPRIEDIPQTAGGGYDPAHVREAFDAYRRHTLQLQAQLRVLQTAGGVGKSEPSGHAVRMDALHLIRAAAEFADAIERDAQNAASSQITRTVSELKSRQEELNRRESDVERHRDESERARADILKTAKYEARELLATANRDATAELQSAEARGARLLEKARHQATEQTNSARAEIEQMLGWAREQASTIVLRAQQGAEQLLTAAGLTPEALATVTANFLDSIQPDPPPAPVVEPQQDLPRARPQAVSPEPAASSNQSDDDDADPAPEKPVEPPRTDPQDEN